MNRADTYKDILEKNLEVIKYKNNVDISLLDYGSTDDLYSFIKNNFYYFLQTKKLTYTKTTAEKSKYWHSHCKNLSHIVAKGDIVSCLDADSQLNGDYINFIFKNISEKTILCGFPSYGQYGNITLLKTNFLKLGGYDEQDYKEIYGNEDSDLVKRARMYGLHKVDVPIYYVKVRHHSDETRVKNTVNDSKSESLHITRRIFNNTLLRNKIVANPNGIVPENVEINFKVNTKIETIDQII
jgi:hypothetical protein